MFNGKLNSFSNRNNNLTARRLQVENLEDRMLLAVMAGMEAAALPTGETGSMVVTTLADVVDANDDVVSLREAMTTYYDANVKTVTFAVSGTIQLNSSISITNEITIEGGKAITIDGGGATGLFTRDADVNATFNGLTMQNANAGAIVSNASFVDAAYGITVDDCAFTGNTNATNGGAIYIFGSYLNVSNSTFTNNSITASQTGADGLNGGAIYTNGTSYIISDSTFTGNFVKNTCTSFNTEYPFVRGGALCLNFATDFADGTFSSVTGCTITNNYATSAYNVIGGGVYVSSDTGSTAAFTETIIDKNEAYATPNEYPGYIHGGGVYCSDGTFNFTDSSISENKLYSTGDMGGGGDIKGAGLHLRGTASVTHVTNSTISHNELYISGYGDGGEAGGGGIYVRDAFLYIDNTNMVENSVSIRGTAFSTYMDGGAVMSYGSSVYAHDSSFTGNCCYFTSEGSGSDTRTRGGAIFTDSSSNPGYLELYNCSVTGNSVNKVSGAGTNSRSYGAGIVAQVETMIVQTLIADNMLYLSGDTDRCYGAALYADGGVPITFINSTITNNNTVDVTNSTDKGRSGILGRSGAGFMTFQGCVLYGNYETYADGTILNALDLRNEGNDGNNTTFIDVLYDSEGIQKGYTTSGNCINLRSTPGIVFTDAANKDYTLAEGSIAIDGTTATEVKDQNDVAYVYDLRGAENLRLVGATVDMGCYESQTAPTPVTPLDAPLFEAGNVASYGANRHSAVWGAVTNAVEYELAYVANDAADWTTVKTAELSVVVTNLTYGAQMAYKVRAIGDGVTYSDSEWSQTLLLNVCPMDVDGDGRIGPADRTLLASAWLARPTSTNWDVRADIDGNNTIASGDRTFLTSNYLKAATATDLSYPPALAEALFADDVEADDVDDFAVPTLDVDFDFFG